MTITFLLWKLVVTLHIISFATWIGGGFFIAVSLYPSLGLLDNMQRNAVLLQSFKRFLKGMSHALVMLFVTGALLAYHIGHASLESRGIIGMTLIAIIIAGIFLKTYFGPFTKAQRAIRPQPELFTSIRKAFLLITLLGFLAILCGALG